MTVDTKMYSKNDIFALSMGMIDYAKRHPFSYEDTKRRLHDETDKEIVGPLVRVRGEKASAFVEHYSRFVFVDNALLQVTYLEYDLKIGQLTIVRTDKSPLNKKSVNFIASHFVDLERAEKMETPPHVSVFCIKVE